GMLKEHSSLVNVFLRAIDWFAIYASGVVAFYLSGVSEAFEQIGQTGLPESYVLVILMVVGLSAAIFPASSVYRVWRGAPVMEELRQVTIGWCALAFVLAALALMTKTGAQYSRMWGGVWFVLGWTSLTTSRIVLRFLLRWIRSQGFNQRQIVIVGTGSLAREVAERVTAANWTGLELLGFFGEPVNDGKPAARELPILGSLDALPAFVEANSVDQVWLAMPLREEKAVKEVLHKLRHSTTDIRFIPDIFGFSLLNHSFSEVAGLPVLDLSRTPMNGLNLWIKEAEDKGLALIILILTSPLLLLLALGVKLSSPGPVFYRQERVSWNGEPFMMFKFRSMPVNCECRTGPTWASRGEKRATTFGQFLRRTSLDELPQFINVLMGHMSIVGPRPERPVFVDQFKDEVPDYMKKHMVKAGITGWAQINGWRGDTDLNMRIEHDIYYIEHWSLWFDLKIIFLTLFKGFTHENAY
ncbi:MAG: undecaprenyl-phosphate glucose phosphotransferase, partial [Pseudomonadota bacterium]|nr:undecaprenyl-phosphate glucose phosphotransferase [Pseudomonadota bacterium]